METNRILNNIINPCYGITSKNTDNNIAELNNNYIKEVYLNQLIEQFKSATGTTNIDLNSAEFIIDFNDWIARNKGIGTISYLSLLDDLGIFFDKKNCAEVGKGYHDSLVLPHETTIITPYIEKLDKRPYNGKTIESAFKVSDGVPIIFERDEIVPETIIKPTEIDTFMTHNPYKGININNWFQLHNSSDYEGIIVSVFGKRYDKDMNEKIANLYNLKRLLEDPYIYEEMQIGDTYCHVLATDTVKKRKLLRLKTDNQ